MFAHFSSSKVCTYLSSMHNVIGHHDISIECLSCDFHVFIFHGCIQASNILVFIVSSFLLVGLLVYLCFQPCSCLHGPTNPPMATLEVSLHVSWPMLF